MEGKPMSSDAEWNLQCISTRSTSPLMQGSQGLPQHPWVVHDPQGSAGNEGASMLQMQTGMALPLGVFLGRSLSKDERPWTFRLSFLGQLLPNTSISCIALWRGTLSVGNWVPDPAPAFQFSCSLFFSFERIPCGLEFHSARWPPGG